MAKKGYPIKAAVEPALAACPVCLKEAERLVAEKGGSHRVPVVVSGGPEVQQCSHLAEWVRNNALSAKTQKGKR